MVDFNGGFWVTSGPHAGKTNYDGDKWLKGPMNITDDGAFPILADIS